MHGDWGLVPATPTRKLHHPLAAVNFGTHSLVLGVEFFGPPPREPKGGHKEGFHRFPVNDGILYVYPSLICSIMYIQVWLSSLVAYYGSVKLKLLTWVACIFYLVN